MPGIHVVVVIDTVIDTVVDAVIDAVIGTLILPAVRSHNWIQDNSQKVGADGSDQELYYQCEQFHMRSDSHLGYILRVPLLVHWCIMSSLGIHCYIDSGQDSRHFLYRDMLTLLTHSRSSFYIHLLTCIFKTYN